MLGVRVTKKYMHYLIYRAGRLVICKVLKTRVWGVPPAGCYLHWSKKRACGHSFNTSFWSTHS